MVRTANRNGRSILIIDDDIRLVKMLKENFQNEGYAVYCGFDGGMATILAQKHRPDLILMDVNMPYIDGLRAFQRLRTNHATAHIPVVFISEMVSHVIFPHVEFAPRSAYLKKPLDLIELNSFLRQFVQRYAA
jgi:DNA-binding response OmpR family regulator